MILERAGVTLSDATTAALTELHAYHVANNLWELVPDDVRPALTAMRALGLKMTIVSNANGTLRAHLARIGLDGYVDCVLDSCDEQVEKPDPRLFEIALARSGARKESTIHVGDLLQRRRRWRPQRRPARGAPGRDRPAARRRLPTRAVTRRARRANQRWGV